MNAPTKEILDTDIKQKMLKTLQHQRDSYIDEGFVSAETRIDRIDRAIDILVTHSEAISEAMNEDFGCRPRETNLMTDVTGSIECLKHSKKHLKKWMKTEKRPTMFPLNLLGGRSSITYQPKGVVGIIAPWNFPLGMVFEPLAGVLAAGNRAMIKPSEFTPATSSLITEIVRSAFDPSELFVFNGGPEVGQAFSTLPFDHLIFTGATSVARHIMAAAAENLVPVTLELGGKSPVIITRSADISEAIQRIMTSVKCCFLRISALPSRITSWCRKSACQVIDEVKYRSRKCIRPSLPIRITRQWSMTAITSVFQKIWQMLRSAASER